MCHRLDGYMCGGPPLVNGTCPHHKGLVPADLSASHAFVLFKVWDTCVRSSLFREGPLFPLPLLEARSGTLVPAPLIQRDRVCGSSLLRAALPCLELCLRAPLPYSARLPVGAPPVLVTPLPSPTSVGYFSDAPSPPEKREPEAKLLASLFPLRAKRGGGGACPADLPL